MLMQLESVGDYLSVGQTIPPHLSEMLLSLVKKLFLLPLVTAVTLAHFGSWKEPPSLSSFNLPASVLVCLPVANG